MQFNLMAGRDNFQRAIFFGDFINEIEHSHQVIMPGIVLSSNRSSGISSLNEQLDSVAMMTPTLIA